MTKFIPVKITDKKWADKLLDGEVFMRPLFEFGHWNINKNESLNNQYRGDIREGMVENCLNVFENPVLKGFSPNLLKHIVNASFIDEDDLRYFKIFSLYCLEYIPTSNFFVKPDPEIKSFGDTAVIIKDFNEFIKRWLLAASEKYKHLTTLVDRIEYYSLDTQTKMIPLFSKSQDYAYQNELRMSFCELEHNIFAMGEGAESAMKIVEDASCITLNIGNIRDIAQAISIEDFLTLNFPRDIKLRFPMNDAPYAPTIYDNIVSATKKEMQNYHTFHITPIITII